MKTSLLSSFVPGSRIAFVAAALFVLGSGSVSDLWAQGGSVTSGEVLKWDRPPALATPTNIYYGWNEPSVEQQQIAADDWVCTTTNPVTGVRWWGSFQNWNSDDATPVLPVAFLIRFWTDTPVGPGNPFSHPQQVVWLIAVTNGIQYTWTCAGKDYDPRTGTFETCFRFDATLPPIQQFFQNPLTGTNIYWLSIDAYYGGTVPTTNSFGWKTRPRDPNSAAPDAAVDIFAPPSPGIGAMWINGNPIFWPTPTNQWDLAFELSATVSSGVGSKWVQPPDISFTGTDINASQQPQIQPPYLLADDFQCTTPGPITNITIWGSWLNDKLPFPPAGGPPDANDVTFVLSIHDDIPASQSPTGYSMPGALLWARSFPPGTFIHSIYASAIQEGWLTPPGNYIFPPADTVCHQYDFPILPDAALIQTGTVAMPKTYWLDVQAMPQSGSYTGPPTNALFGWKTSTTNWNDSAVWANATEGFFGPWNELVYPAIHPKAGTNVDMAFRINTGPLPPTTVLKWSQPPVVATNPGNWFNGWNEPSIYGGGIWNGLPLTNIVADDWLCSNPRPVTDIHWWGSFLGWTGTGLPPQMPIAFQFAIWTDFPEGPNAPFSHPDTALWQYVASVTDSNLQSTWVGWDVDPRSPCSDIESCFRFDYNLPGTNNWFFQAAGTNVYWLSISAVYPAGTGLGQNPFGWKTRPHLPVPPDDAVRIFDPLNPAPGSVYANGEPIEFPPGSGWDMAFQLSSCQQYPPIPTLFTNVTLTNIIGGHVLTFRWNSQPGVVYQFQHVFSLTNHPVNPWVDIGSPIVGPINAASFTNVPLELEHYYRIKLPDICP